MCVGDDNATTPSSGQYYVVDGVMLVIAAYSHVLSKREKLTCIDYTYNVSRLTVRFTVCIDSEYADVLAKIYHSREL